MALEGQPATCKRRRYTAGANVSVINPSAVFIATARDVDNGTSYSRLARQR